MYFFRFFSITEGSNCDTHKNTRIGTHQTPLWSHLSQTSGLLLDQKTHKSGLALQQY
uniref:Uncharacterized protein n=1 Tax=Anguilla anguilla TaxID=7936 RepID=A0A0E9UWN9_ANGAN